MKEKYRNECYGSGIIDIFKIIKFEIMELHNSDILDFFVNNYGLKVDIEDYYTEIENENISEKDINELIENMKEILVNIFGHSNLFGLWLTTFEGVKKNYIFEEDRYVNRYIFPNSRVIPVSDLGDQGVLFVFEENPDFFTIEEIEI